MEDTFCVLFGENHPSQFLLCPSCLSRLFFSYRLNSRIDRGQFHRLTTVHIRHRIRHHLVNLVQFPEVIILASIARKPIPIIRADPDKNSSGLPGHVGRRGQGGGGAFALVHKVDGNGACRKGRTVGEMTVSGVKIDLIAVRLQEL